MRKIFTTESFDFLQIIKTHLLAFFFRCFVLFASSFIFIRSPYRFFLLRTSGWFLTHDKWSDVSQWHDEDEGKEYRRSEDNTHLVEINQLKNEMKLRLILESLFSLILPVFGTYHLKAREKGRNLVFKNPTDN